MRLYLLKRKLKSYWKKKWVRIVVILIVLAVALLLQYWLANIPEPLDLGSEVKRFTLPYVMPGQELLIEGPGNDDSHALLIAHEGRFSEELDAHLSNGRLSQATLSEYQSLRPPPPSGTSEIDCSSTNWDAPSNDSPQHGQNPNVSNPCNTSVTIRLAPGREKPTAFAFFQSDTTGRERYRQLVMRVHGAEALVNLTMVPPDSPDNPHVDNQIDCGKYVRVGEWNHRLGGVNGAGYEIETIMSPNSTIRLRFSPLADNALWSGGPEGFFEPFLFSSSDNPNLDTPIESRSVSITSMTDGKVFFKASAAGAGRISIDNVKVGTDRLMVSMRGEAFVTVNGKPVSIDLFELIKKYWLISGFLAMANTALLAWFVRVLRGLFSSQA
jgi:hypothetical protein